LLLVNCTDDNAHDWIGPTSPVQPLSGGLCSMSGSLPLDRVRCIQGKAP
jgi:hypothetical protein